MSLKKKLLLLAALIIPIVLIALIIRSLPLHTDSLYGIKVTSDGTGGSISIYEDTLGGDIYAQKISSDGRFLWGEKGVLLGNSHSQFYSFSGLNVVSDGSGGALVAWPDLSPGLRRSTTHLARIDSEGKTLWQRDFIYFNRLISDGAGGAIIAFDQPVGVDIIGDETRYLNILRVDSQGKYPWGLPGVIIPRQKYQSNTLQLVSDSFGGAIVVWEETEPQPGAKIGSANLTYRLFAQRVTSQGKTWESGTLLYTTPEGIWIESPYAEADGEGGVVLSWFQVTENPAEPPGHRQIYDIAAQKIDATGKTVWQTDDPIEVTRDDSQPMLGDHVLTTSGSGSAIIVWMDRRNATGSHSSLYAQKVDANGMLLWQLGGCKVASTSMNPRPLMVEDNSGGAIIAYSFLEDLKILNVQKLDRDGNAVWGENGASITTDGFSSFSIASDGQGGAIITWGVGKGMFNSEKAYLQRVSTDGRLLWGDEGIRLNR